MFTRKDLFRLIFPLVIEQFLAITIGMIDTVMVSSVGEAAVAGISLVDSINILLINVFSALATGGAIVASQHLGNNDPENANTAAQQLLVATLAVSVVIMGFSIAFKVPILNTIFGKTEQAVMNNCYIYFFWSAVSYPFLAVYNAGAALFRAMGNSKISMIVSILMNLLNVVGNAVLIFGFNMGVAGAAIATLVSRIVGAGIMLYLLRYQENIIQLKSLIKFKINLKMIKTILGVGIPNGLENGMFQIGKILLQSLIASFGTVAVTANAICNTIAGFVNVPGSAISLAMITVVGQCTGANEYDQAYKYTRKLTKLAYVTMAAASGIVLLLLNPILGAFNLSAETTALAKEIVIICCIVTAILWPEAFTMPNGLRAANDVKYTMTVSACSMWIFRIGFSYLLHSIFDLGVMSVWIAMYIDWFFRIVFFEIRLCGDKWKTKRLV